MSRSSVSSVALAPISGRAKSAGLKASRSSSNVSLTYVRSSSRYAAPRRDRARRPRDRVRRPEGVRPEEVETMLDAGPGLRDELRSATPPELADILEPST
jgi:hypothetical protein